MSRTGINYVDVASAAAKVQGRNENPTVDRIREILGTGSKSTIARHLKEWRTNNGSIATTSGLPEELVALITGLWERLQREADQEILDYQTIVDEKIQEMDENLNEIQKKNLELQQQNHTLEESSFKIGELNKTNEELLKDERITTAKQQTQICSLEDLLSMQKQENAKVHSLLKNIQNNLEHYQDVMQKLQQEQTLALDKQKNHFEQDLAMLRHQLSEAVKIEYELKNDKQRLMQDLAQLDIVSTEKLALELKCKQQESQLNNLQQVYSSVLAENEKAISDIALKHQAIVDSNQKAAIAHSRAHDLEKEMQKLEDKIANLRQEQIFVVQEKSRLEGQLKQLMEYSIAKV